MLPTNTMKKGDLSIQTIVSFTLLLIMLVVMLYLMSDKLGAARTDLKSCETKGGECVRNAEECDEGTAAFECPDNMVCCLNGIP